MAVLRKTNAGSVVICRLIKKSIYKKIYITKEKNWSFDFSQAA